LEVLKGLSQSSVAEFLELDVPAFDVRSPREFSHAHIPGAFSLPLFTDAERALVGTAYKRQGKKEAIDLGVEIVGPKLYSLLKQAEMHAQKECKLYCWRGGMRSEFVRFFLSFTGMRAVQLKGGYKAYRHLMLQTLEKPAALYVLGGLTGSGKTELLEVLDAPKIDLEKLASHRGSVYGEMPGLHQPSCEQFENMLGHTLYANKGPFWVEDESRMIGSCKIPDGFFEAMLKAPFIFLDSPKEERVLRIHRLYGGFEQSWWIQMTLKIQKRLGGMQTRQVLSFIEQNDLLPAIDTILTYYDGAYQYAIERRRKMGQGPVIFIKTTGKSRALIAKEIQDAAYQSAHSVHR
jgi:tRNA 2-selenouridine synthase